MAGRDPAIQVCAIGLLDGRVEHGHDDGNCIVYVKVGKALAKEPRIEIVSDAGVKARRVACALEYLDEFHGMSPPSLRRGSLRPSVSISDGLARAEAHTFRAWRPAHRRGVSMLEQNGRRLVEPRGIEPLTS